MLLRFAYLLLMRRLGQTVFFIFYWLKIKIIGLVREKPDWCQGVCPDHTKTQCLDKRSFYKIDRDIHLDRSCKLGNRFIYACFRKI